MICERQDSLDKEVDEEIRFLVTKELGRLATWLRILGFDTQYSKSIQKSQIVIESLQESRIILTKNRKIGERQGLRVIHLKSDFFKEQLKQLREDLTLELNSDKFFMRCVLCNKELERVDKKSVKERVPQYVYETQENFVECPSCKRLFWKGTHWGNVEEVLREV